MATSQGTIDFILDQASAAGVMSARKMFGEYALYCNGKVVGLVCDDTLYIKITEQGKQFVGSQYREGYAYKGAKASMVIDGDLMEDYEWLGELIRITADSIPAQKKKIK
jgi:TfoX/Sxy family transcriptional regulator of competence genes